VNQGNELEILFHNVNGRPLHCIGDGTDLPGADVYAFVETHWDESQASRYVFPKDGYKHFWVCRDSRRGGGISVLVHESIQHKLVSRIPQPETLLLSIGHSDLLLGIVYLPPPPSCPSTHEATTWLTHLQHAVLQAAPHKHTILLGDFNARIGNWQLRNIPDPHGPPLPPCQTFPPRQSKDTSTNSFGPVLIHFMESMGLGVANGCVPGDTPGEYTRHPVTSGMALHSRRQRARHSLVGGAPSSPYLDTFSSSESESDNDSVDQDHNSSPEPSHASHASATVLDLAILTPHLLSHIVSMCFSPTPFSDHSRMLLKLTTVIGRANATQALPPKGKGYVWDKVLATLYQEEVQLVLPQLQGLAASVTNRDTPRTLARATRAYMAILRRCKTRALHRKATQPRTGLGNTPQTLSVGNWWSQDLRVARQRLLSLFAQIRATGQGTQEYLQARKQYKLLLRKKRNAFEQARDQFIHRLLRGHPKAFWSWWTGHGPNQAAITPDAYTNHMSTTLGHMLGNHLPSSIAQQGIHPPHLNNPVLLALNSPFTEAEVVNAIYKLKNGKASADGFQAELLRSARDPNTELPNASASWVKRDLTSILNAVYLGGSGVPRSWLKAYVTPVFKGRGDPTVPSNYRPITVSGLLYKLFSSVLLTRLQNALEQLGVRAPTQLGFRQGKGTEQAIWLLHHCITRACSKAAKGGLGGQLYTCFIDLKQAFDSVDRELLWARLEHLGIPNGPFFQAIKSLYSSTEFGVRIAGCTSDSHFRTSRGVKQGCPISPLLFGLVMDHLYHRLQTDCPDVGVTLLDHMGTILNHIMYADDVVLFALSQADLQRLVDAVQVFCAEVGLSVNADKSVVMVFDLEGRRSPQTEVDIMIGGNQKLQQVTTFKYLGVQFHSTAWVRRAGQSKATDAARAVGALWRGAQTHQVNCRDTLLRLYRAQVLPISVYGAGIWGMHHLSLSHADAVMSSASQNTQNLFLRLISGAHDSVSRWVLHRNAAMQPIQLEIFKAMARLWSTLKKDNIILQHALRSDIALFGKGAHCWSGEFIQHLFQLGCFPDIQGTPSIAKRHLHTLGVDDFFLRPFAVTSISKRVVEFYDDLWLKEVNSTPLRDHAESSSVSARRFHSHIFQENKHYHLTYHGPSYLVDTLFRFRVGAAGLRAGVHSTDPTDRVCPLCNHSDIEDEHHVITVCEAYSHIRRSPTYESLFSILERDGLQAFFNTDNQHLLARCLHHMLRIRKDMLVSAVS